MEGSEEERLRVLETYLQEQLMAVRARLYRGRPPAPQPVGDKVLADSCGWWLEYRRSPTGWRPTTVHTDTCFVKPAGKTERLTPDQARALLARADVGPCPGCRNPAPPGPGTPKPRQP
ncbi:hypothetical protein GCM10023347_07230 [Streptomyces chumphonensis]|uniref:Uncharacterized protein n=1 Tax=Streptomyces chumphonensis TaxID=1214925 RepID=A0A927F4J5_9ACTN|nr:DUF6233 domain-containing protein [Streptomyces chumphonensis]MBD3934880.1 hypothetical protein [Streptomyces chumphonensis]